MAKYFGTDGIRGEVGVFPITPDFALRLGYAFGKVLWNIGKNPTIVIGKDTRLSGYLFESSLEAGLSYAGVDVYLAGCIPTPAVAYLVQDLQLSAGIVISASHNPYNDNGIKFFSSLGTKFDSDIEDTIERQLELPMIKAEKLGRVRRLEDAKDRYVTFCKNTILKNVSFKPLKIVLDCANGATYQVAPSVFEGFGAEVIKISCEPDGENINLCCGSTDPQLLIESVKLHKADLGIAFDGDGDRVIFVDQSGELYNGDKLIYIILQAYLAQGLPITGIVGTVMTNLALENSLKKYNCELVRAKVGDKYVLKELESRGWLIGGESSGHILCLDKHSTGDGIVSALQVVQAIVQFNKSLNDFIDWKDYPQVMVNVKLKERQYSSWENMANPVINEAINALALDGRVVVRASGTEPLVRVMVEAKNYALADKWAKQIANKVVQN